MKTYPKTRAASRHFGTHLPLLTILSLASVAPLSAADPAPPKDHALFVGATLQVEDGPGFFEIVGAKGDSVSLQADGKLHHIRRDAIRNVRTERSLALSDVVAQIEKMTVTPTYVPSNADRFADMRMQVLMSDMAYVAGRNVGTATGKSLYAESAQDLATSGLNFARPGEFPHGSSIAVPEVDPNAIMKASNSYVTMQSSVDSFGHGGRASTGANALDIACELSTPRVMHNTYALVLTEFREATSGKSSYILHVEPVGELGPKPQHMTFTQDGLPPGFILGRVDIHLYRDGQELATNLSEERVDLTAEDALHYLVVCYIASHAKDSLAATPLSIVLPSGFKRQAVAADLERTLYVKVGADGVVQGLSGAPDNLVAVDPYVDSAVRKFRYNPALKEGKPVDSIVELRLASLPL